MNKFLILAASCLISGSAMADACDFDCNYEATQFCYDNCYDCCDCYCDDAKGVYVGALGGLNFLDINKKKDVELTTNTGWMIGGVVGYKFCNNLRVEGELAYRRNGLDAIKYAGIGADVKGRVAMTTLMANVIYDIDLGNEWTPYVGGGIGYSNTYTKVTNVAGFGVSQHGTHEDFAVQGIAGLAYRIAPKTDLGLEYRYMKPNAKFKDHSAVLSVRQYF